MVKDGGALARANLDWSKGGNTKSLQMRLVPRHSDYDSLDVTG